MESGDEVLRKLQKETRRLEEYGFSRLGEKLRN
jgi:hypothetical protein